MKPTYYAVNREPCYAVNHAATARPLDRTAQHSIAHNTRGHSQCVLRRLHCRQRRCHGAPLKTIAAAIAKIGRVGDSQAVVLRGGTHYLDATLELSATPQGVMKGISEGRMYLDNFSDGIVAWLVANTKAVLPLTALAVARQR